MSKRGAGLGNLAFGSGGINVDIGELRPVELVVVVVVVVVIDDDSGSNVIVGVVVGNIEFLGDVGCVGAISAALTSIKEVGKERIRSSVLLLSESILFSEKKRN
jgi:hypothetical protein